MTLTLRNPSDDFLKAFKSLAKLANVDFTISKERASKSKEKEFHTLKELDEMPFMKKLKKWEKNNPQEAKQARQEVLDEMGLA